MAICFSVAASAATRPNIILLESDDHNFAILGCMGAAVKTPNLDRLAARGVLFRNAIAQGTACSPSRNALLTGSYPHHTGVYHNQDGNMPWDVWTFPAALQRAGYLTALVGKNHFKPASTIHPRDITLKQQVDQTRSLGFEHVHAVAGKVVAATGKFVPGQDPYRDYLHQRKLLEKLQADYSKRDRNLGVDASVLDEADYHDTYIANQTIEFIQKRDRQRPLFLWVDFVSPHPPADAPAPYATMYDWQQMPDRIPPPPGKALVGRQKISAENLKKFRAAYYGMVTYLDAQVGRIVDALQQSGELDKTIVIFAGDQGSMLGDHGEMGKGVFYKGSINAPLIMAGPGISSGKLVDRPVELIGLAPMILEIAQATTKEIAQCKGTSLLPLVSGRGEYRRNEAFAEEFETKMVVDARYKYVHDPKEPMLFDLQADPREMTNLASQQPERAAAMKKQIADWLRSTPPVKDPNAKVRPAKQ